MENNPPINISKSSMVGNCDEKCAYSFKYQISPTCKAKNYKTYISLSYDNSGLPPAIFNNFSYNVSNIELYSPSIHTFNNNYLDAEIIINHTSNSTGSPLMICIPISVNGVATTGSQIITDIITAVSSYPLHYKDPEISINVNNYNLDDIIPKDPYFYYVGKSSNANIVVFNGGSAISVSQSAITNLKSIISESIHTVAPGVDNSLFYNAVGPASSNSLNDGIYIDCKPTGDSEETTDVSFTKPNPSYYDLGSYVNSDFLTIIIASVGFIALLYIINKLLIYMTNL